MSLLAISIFATVFAMTLKQPARREAAAVAVRSVSVPLSGKIAALEVKNGDFVRKGQWIAQLDSSAYEIDLAKAEGELKQIQDQSQAAIQPLIAIPGISGTFPKELPKPQVVKVPAKKAIAPAPQPEMKPAIDPYKVASDKQQRAKAALDKATQALAKATTSVTEAQQARDALRPKEIQAQVAATQAAKKADQAQQWLDAGVISRKRAEQLSAEKDAAQKDLEAVKGLEADAEKGLADAKGEAQAAQTAVDAATAALQKSDDLLAKAAATPAPKTPAPAAKPKPAMEAKIVTRRPLVVNTEEAPAIPMKVMVDEKAMESSETRIAELKKKIADLKARIAACRVLAPTDGQIQISPSGEIAVLVPISTSDR
ncbi:MAG TPA: biotin/lipoyl-binding protein [Fimbriimonadaceae bacterium]|nr:biotin/lipoyl-binding protein [Fimbriimonadaceae bacterium]